MYIQPHFTFKRSVSHSKKKQNVTESILFLFVYQYLYCIPISANPIGSPSWIIRVAFN